MPQYTLTDNTVVLSIRPETLPMIELSRSLSAAGIGVKQIRLPLSSGDMLVASARVATPIERGGSWIRFVPRRGTENLERVIPEGPLTRPIKTVNMPRGVGAVVVVEYVRWLVESVWPLVQPLVDALTEILARLKAQQDVELATETLTLAQVNPQAASARLRSRTLTRTKTQRRAGIRTHRIRGYSRT